MKSKFPFKCLLALLLFLCTITPLALGQISKDYLSSLPPLFQKWRGKKPGAALGIIYQGKLIYERGWGMADLQQALAIDSKSQFHLASMSKQFIATAIGLLIQEGKLLLKDPIVKYLPELNANYHSISIEQLLHQISGIKDYSNLMLLRANRKDDFIPLEQGIALLNRLQGLNFEPGTQFSYSNSNYLFLAEIIRRVSQMDFRDYIRQNIFVPLGMNNTYFVDYKTGPAAKPALDYTQDKNGNYVPFSKNLMAAKDQIISNIQDLYLWDQNFTHKKVGGPGLIDFLLEKGKLKNGQETRYASGLFVGNYRGMRTISHSGDMGGYHSQYLQFPDEELSIIILANAADLPAYSLSYRVADKLLKDKFHSLENPPEENIKSIFLSNKALKKFQGDYWNASAQRPRVIYLRDDTLRYNRPDYYESPLIPIAQNQFRMLDRRRKPSASLDFQFDEEGQLKSLRLQNPGKPPLMMKKYKYPSYKVKQLIPFVGKYYSKELEMTYEIRLPKSKLMVYINGKAQSRLRAIYSDYFVDNYFGDFHFLRDEQNQIKGFYLDRTRARNMYFESVPGEK